VSRYITSAPNAQKTFSRISHCCVSTNCRRDLFTSALRSNVRDADLIENSFSAEICLRRRCLATVCVNTPHYSKCHVHVFMFFVLLVSLSNTADYTFVFNIKDIGISVIQYERCKLVFYSLMCSTMFYKIY
jgi:hypothetical protein